MYKCVYIYIQFQFQFFTLNLEHSDKTKKSGGQLCIYI